MNKADFPYIVYHYTQLGNVARILSEEQGGGLVPKSAIARRRWLEVKDKRRTSYALLDPLPRDWISNPNFPLTWDALRHDLGFGVLLEVDVRNHLGATYVAERAYVEGYLYLGKAKLSVPSQFSSYDEIDAIRAYMNSMTHIEDYLRQAETSNRAFELPEVFITDTVTPEDIRVSPVQPLLEESVLREGVSNYDIQLLIEGHGSEILKPWRKDFELRQGSLGGRISSKERV